MREVPRTCTECQAPIPTEAPGGLCPRCLLQGVADPTEASTDGGAGSRAVEPAALPAPDDAVFDRAWALKVLERGLSEVEKEFVAAGTGREFALLKPWLIPGTADDGRRREAVAIELGMSDGALRTAVHRLRRRFRAVIKSEIRSTVRDEAEVEAELQHLIRALSVSERE